MIIRRLKVLNVKRLRDATFVPPDDASLVVLAGKNDNGKSSALDSICMVLGGGAFDPPEPIRRGEERASAEIDLGPFKVKCVWTAGGRRLEIIDTADPAGKVASPQTFLDRLVGPLGFDPLAFSRMPPREQVRTLAELLKIDFVAADRARVSAVEGRTAARREQKAAKEKAERLGETIVDFTARDVSISELTSSYREASEHNARLDDLLREKDTVLGGVADLEAEVKKLEERLAQCRFGLVIAGERLEKLNELLGAAERRDLAEIQVKIDTAETRNAEARKVAEYNVLVAAVESASSSADAADMKVLKIDAWKKKQLAEAPFPIPGLSFAEDGSGVLLNDLPFEQAGDAAKIKVGVAIGLAMSKEIKVLLIRDGSLLDDDAMDAIEAMAKEAGAQVWVERVSAEGPCTWRIVDGSIEADDEATP